MGAGGGIAAAAALAASKRNKQKREREEEDDSVINPMAGGGIAAAAALAASKRNKQKMEKQEEDDSEIESSMLKKRQAELRIKYEQDYQLKSEAMHSASKYKELTHKEDGHDPFEECHADSLVCTYERK